MQAAVHYVCSCSSGQEVVLEEASHPSVTGPFRAWSFSRDIKIVTRIASAIPRQHAPSEAKGIG